MINLFGVIDENDIQFVRERYGEPRFGIPAPFEMGLDGRYKKINPHESKFIMEDGSYCSVFHVKPIYYATLQGTWRPLYEVASYYGNKRGMTLKDGWEKKMDFGYLAWYIKRLEAMKSQYGVAVSYPQTYAGIELTPIQVPMLLNASPLTAYPDAHTETDSVDGYVRHATDTVNWSDLVNGAGTSAADNGATITSVSLGAEALSGHWFKIDRGVFLYKTSSIGAGQKVDSATLSLHGFGKSDGLSCTPTINIYSSAPASNTALAAGDFDSLGSTAFSTAITYASWSTSAYNDFALNASGIAAIAMTGISKFGTRDVAYDIGNTAPNWVTNESSTISCDGADTADTTSDPKLVVNYSAAASGPANLKTLNTNLAANVKSYNTNLIANVKSINTNV